MEPHFALFHEGMDLLYPERVILPYEETRRIFDTFELSFPIGMESKISWKNVPEIQYKNIESSQEVIPALRELLSGDISTFIYPME